MTQHTGMGGRPVEEPVRIVTVDVDSNIVSMPTEHQLRTAKTVIIQTNAEPFLKITFEKCPDYVKALPNHLKLYKEQYIRFTETRRKAKANG